MTPRVREILSWYSSDSPGVLNNMARLLNHGRLGGSGKLVILPVDQGFEHGPARSFAKNPDGYDPFYHATLALESGCNAYAAPLGFIEAIARDFAGEIPLILKANQSDSLYSPESPISAQTSSVEDALRLGCLGIGFTIYPGSSRRKDMYEQVQVLASRAKEAGLLVVIWSYPRGEQLSKSGETALDVVAYAAQIAAQLGAHLIKVKPPTAYLEQAEAKKVYQGENIPLEKLSDRVRHVIQSAFSGRRMVIFSGGPAKGSREILEEVTQLARGGSFGSIMGRNAFQRPRSEALELLREVMEIYGGNPSEAPRGEASRMESRP